MYNHILIWCKWWNHLVSFATMFLLCSLFPVFLTTLIKHLNSIFLSLPLSLFPWLSYTARKVSTIWHNLKYQYLYCYYYNNNYCYYYTKFLFCINRMKQLGITHDSGKVSFGQLYGMCDQVSYSLGEQLN